jgi:acetylornithine deacetylase
VGNEGACQQYVADFLSRNGYGPTVYNPLDAPGLTAHPLYWPGRDYSNRPNVGARLPGSGGGRSLVLSGHIDTVPAGELPWTRSPFSGDRDGNLIYGRGSNDMKAGVATNLFVVEALRDLGIKLRGDLVFESIVDEEFGGSNGTLAGRLMGYNGDAAIVSEPSFLRICAAQRGGRTAHITLSAGPNAGILNEGEFPTGVLHPLRAFLNAVPEFSAKRKKSAPSHPMYAHHSDPVPVAITRLSTAPWGTTEPTRIPDSCKIEMYWQAMPGEPLEEIDREFFEWLDSVSKALPVRPDVVFPIRWLPGSSIDAGEPLVRELAATAKETLGAHPQVVGIEGPCDMFIFQQVFGIPAVLWGARGGNTHNADEYVEIDSVVDAAKVQLAFVCRWCGTE